MVLLWQIKSDILLHKYIMKDKKFMKIYKLEKRTNCFQCDKKTCEKWICDNRDFICISILNKPIRHTELGLSKDNTIRKCVNIKGIGCRVEEMTWEELNNICVLGARILKRLGRV